MDEGIGPRAVSGVSSIYRIAHWYLPWSGWESVAWALAEVSKMIAVGGWAYWPPETTVAPVTLPASFTTEVTAAPLPIGSLVAARNVMTGAVKYPEPVLLTVSPVTAYSNCGEILAPVPPPPTMRAVTPLVVAPVPPYRTRTSLTRPN